MKVAFINQPWVDSVGEIKSLDSMALWTYEVSRRLARSCDVVVYIGHKRFSKRIETYDGVEYRCIPSLLDRTIGKLLRPFSEFFPITRPLASASVYALPYALQIALDLRKQNCDVVHIHFFSQFVPIIRAFNPDIKIILHTHDEWLNQLDARMLSKRLSSVDSIIGCSEYLTQKVRNRFPWLANRCRTIFNGVDPVRFSKAAGSRAEVKPDQKLLFVGRVSPEKGLHVLLDAFKEVSTRFPNAQLNIVGPESVAPMGLFVKLSSDRRVRELRQFYSGKHYLSRLKRQLPEDIKDRVFFTETFIKQSDLVRHYLEADVLVNPSLVESFGMCLLEAMATELPVVATRAGGMPEVIEDGKTGLLVESNNAKALAGAILYLLKDQELNRSMGYAGRQRVLETFSWEQITKSLLFHYQSIHSASTMTSLKR